MAARTDGDKPLNRGSQPQTAEIILAALALVALANVAVVIAGGGYDFRILGVRVKATSVDRPVFIASALFLIRWLASLRRTGLAGSLRGLFPWGMVSGAAGLAVFLTAARSGPGLVGPGHAMVAGVLLFTFMSAWVSYGSAYPRVVRGTVFALYAAFAWAIAWTTLDQKAWGKSITFRTASRISIDTVPADTEGLLLSAQSGARLYKANVADDWRDAAEVSPGGFFSAKVDAPADSAISMSICAKGGKGTARAAVTAVASGARTPLWQQDVSASDSASWRDVRIPLPVSGGIELVFEVNGGDGSPSVLFANPRVGPRPAKGPSILFVVCDALRRDRLGVYGYKRPTSPEVDAFASEATVFDDCVAQGPWTPPSVGTFFTGLYPMAHGMQSRTAGLGASLDTLAGQLRKAGYFTGAIQANGIMWPEVGVAKGFNEYFQPGNGVLTAADKWERASAEKLTDRAISWIDANAGSPFMLYLQYMETHTPYAPNPKYQPFGEDDSSQYDTEVRHFSAEFGRLMEYLKAKGLGDVVVILTADHGEQFMEHGMVEHGGGLYPEGLNVPLIIRAPGRMPAGRVGALVGGIDVAPTVLDLAGAPALPEAAGFSLLPVAGGAQLPERKLYSELVSSRLRGQVCVSVIEGRYRFVLWNPGESRWQRIACLYDMVSDRSEYVNLAASNEALVTKLRDDVEAHVDAQNALHRKLVPEEPRRAISDDQMRQLSALGYVGGGPTDN